MPEYRLTVYDPTHKELRACLLEVTASNEFEAMIKLFYEGSQLSRFQFGLGYDQFLALEERHEGTWKVLHKMKGKNLGIRPE